MCGCALSCVRLCREAQLAVPRPLELSATQLSTNRRWCRSRHTRWMIDRVGVGIKPCDVLVCTFVRAPLQRSTVGGSSATGTFVGAALQSPQPPPPQQAHALDDRVGVGMCGCALSCVHLFREAQSTVPRQLALSPLRLSNRRSRRRNRHACWMIVLVLASGHVMCGCALSCVRLCSEAQSVVPRPLALSSARLSNRRSRRRRNRHTRWMIALVLACVGVHFRACDFAGRHSWRFLDHWNCRQRSSPPIAVGVAAGTRAG